MTTCVDATRFAIVHNETWSHEQASTRTVTASVGVALAVCAGGVNAIGLSLQKRGHGDRDPATLQYLTSRTWWMGFVFILASEAVGSVAYGFAPASIVSALGATTVLFNTLIALACGGEKLTAYKLMGIATLVETSVLLAVASPDTHRVYDEAALRTFYAAPRSVAYLIGSALAVLGLRSLTRCASPSSLARLARIALSAALVSSWTVIAVRGALVIALSCDSCACVAQSWLFWIQVVVVLVTATLAGGFIEQEGVATFDQIYWVPVHYVACAFFFGLSSTIVYDEFGAITQWGGIVVSVGACLWSILLLSL